jgi:hypothetical protein
MTPLLFREAASGVCAGVAADGTSQLANRHNIDLVFLDRHGDPFARVWQTK